MVLNLLRKKKVVKRIIWGIAIVIVPAFIFWGSGSAIRGKRNVRFAGTIFGKRISLRDYTQSLDACRNQARLIYGDNFSKIAEYLDLHTQAWNRLILLNRVKREGISVKDYELIDWIKTSALFRKDGKFDQDRYNLLLQYFLRIEPREFEEELRDSLKITKLQEAVVREIQVSDNEVKEAYRQKNEKAEASYIVIGSKDTKYTATITAEELKEYYKNNSEKFQRPQQVNVEYLHWAFEKFKDNVLIADEEIEDYYDAHLNEFPLPANITKEGKKLSAEDSESKKEPRYRPLSEVKDSIKSNLILQEAKRKAQIEASAVVETIFDAVNLGNTTQETGLFAVGEPIPGVGVSYEFTKEAFSLTKDKISNIITTPKGLYIMKLKEEKAPYTLPFEEVKTKAEKAVRSAKTKELAKKKAEEVITKIKGSSFEKTARKLSLEIKKSNPFTRKDYIPDIGQASQFSSSAFNLEINAVSEAVPIPQGYAILRLDNIEAIDEEKFLQEKEEFKKTLLEKKKEILFQSWFEKLKKEANLKSRLR